MSRSTSTDDNIRSGSLAVHWPRMSSVYSTVTDRVVCTQDAIQPTAMGACAVSAATQNRMLFCVTELLMFFCQKLIKRLTWNQW